MEWWPQAVRRDGPAWKAGYISAGLTKVKRGEVKHSAEGYWAGLYSVLDGPARSSWHFTVGYDRVEQHYALSWNTWHGNDTDNDGAVMANLDLIGIEHLGVAGEPLTEYQVHMTTELTRWAAAQFGLSTFARYPQQAEVWTLAEHKQVGDTATGCPSNRIPWDEILKRLQGNDMSQADIEELADRRALSFVLEELNWDEKQGGNGMYRTVSVDDNGTHLLIELMTPQRTPLSQPVKFWVRK